MAMAILTCSLSPCSSAAGPPPPLPPCCRLNTACSASRSRARCRSGSSESSEESLVSLASPAAVFVSSAEDVVGPVVVVVAVAETRARAAAGSLWFRSR